MDDLISRKFGKLTIKEKAENHISPCGTKCEMYLCECECGNRVVVQLRNLKSGNTKSCGCHRAKTTEKLHLKHGYAKRGKEERLYHVWKSMLSRCNCKNNSRYARYGGRGISVCAEWNNDYEAFREWALNNGYDETAPFGRCTIDRIDNDGNYEPNNCRFVDMKVQANNRGGADMRKKVQE